MIAPAKVVNKMSVPKARMTDIHDDKQGDDDDVTLLDIVKENGQKPSAWGG